MAGIADEVQYTPAALFKLLCYHGYRGYLLEQPSDNVADRLIVPDGGT